MEKQAWDKRSFGDHIFSVMPLPHAKMLSRYLNIQGWISGKLSGLKVKSISTGFKAVKMVAVTRGNEYRWRSEKV